MNNKKFKIWSGIYKNFNETTKKIEGKGFESKKYINRNYKELKKCLKDKKIFFCLNNLKTTPFSCSC